MKIKLLSAWFGKKRDWFGKFAEQMKRFSIIDWECIPPPEVPLERQLSWINDIASRKTRVRSRKGNKDRDAVCDFRPLYGELFAHKYAGYDYWGWCDLDILFGDLDRLLPTLLTDEVDVLHFKEPYLSGCFVILKNTPTLTEMYKKGKYIEVLSDRNYHGWDENGYRGVGGETFYQLMVREGVHISSRQDLMSYDAPKEKHQVELRDGRVLRYPSGEEALFHHFMSDIWPIREDGSPV